MGWDDGKIYSTIKWYIRADEQNLYSELEFKPVIGLDVNGNVFSGEQKLFLRCSVCNSR